MMITLIQLIGDYGTPLSYSPRTDDVIALVLLICFFLSSFVLSRTKKQLLLQLKSFAFHRERTSIFAEGSNIDIRFHLLLILQTCIFAGLFLFNYVNDTAPDLMIQYSSLMLMGLYIAMSLVYLFFKWLMYEFLGWIFFDKGRTNLWLDSYFTLIYYVGFALFPFVLLLIYFDLNIEYLVIIGLILALFVKILMFYKWIKLFFNNILALFLLILYFCALEIIPCLIFYRGLIELNNLLTIKL